MKQEIKKIHGFKIIPDKFRSSTLFDVKDYFDEDFQIELYDTDELNLDDYSLGGEVEIFGLGKDGLVYFTSLITGKDENSLKIKYPEKLKNIQRREYSRVKFEGDIKLIDFPDATTEPVDISAGGVKFYIDNFIEKNKVYEAIIKLKNNIEIKCDLEVLNVFDAKNQKHDIRARFMNMSSIDRIGLIQYSFQVLLENENK